jgi:hypothetical protein
MEILCSVGKFSIVIVFFNALILAKQNYDIFIAKELD